MMALEDLQILQGFFCAVPFPEKMNKLLVHAGFRPAGPDYPGYRNSLLKFKWGVKFRVNFE